MVPRSISTGVKAAISRFRRDRRGATAVEFALISVPFMMLIFGVLELAMIFLAATILENATEGVSRRIRTGEFQTSAAATKGDFKSQVCQSMSFLQSKCASDLYVDVRTFSSFAGLAAAPTPAPPPPAPAPDTTCFTPGKPTDIVLVRVYYKWKLFTPMLSQIFETPGAGSGVRLMSSATAFRNEPYSDDLPQGAAC